jgi:hypothetical protein
MDCGPQHLAKHTHSPFHSIAIRSRRRVQVLCVEPICFNSRRKKGRDGKKNPPSLVTACVTCVYTSNVVRSAIMPCCANFSSQHVLFTTSNNPTIRTITVPSERHLRRRLLPPQASKGPLQAFGHSLASRVPPGHTASSGAKIIVIISDASSISIRMAHRLVAGARLHLNALLTSSRTFMLLEGLFNGIRGLALALEVVGMVRLQASKTSA